MANTEHSSPPIGISSRRQDRRTRRSRRTAIVVPVHRVVIGLRATLSVTAYAVRRASTYVCSGIRASTARAQDRQLPWRRIAVKQDQRAPFVHALHRARLSAYGPGQFVEQEGFMRAAEILALARRADIGSWASVLDLCCGVAGPGRFITAELGCSYLG